MRHGAPDRPRPAPKDVQDAAEQAGGSGVLARCAVGRWRSQWRGDRARDAAARLPFEPKGVARAGGPPAAHPTGVCRYPGLASHPLARWPASRRTDTAGGRSRRGPIAAIETGLRLPVKARPVILDFHQIIRTEAVAGKTLDGVRLRRRRRIIMQRRHKGRGGRSPCQWAGLVGRSDPRSDGGVEMCRTPDARPEKHRSAHGAPHRCHLGQGCSARAARPNLRAV